MYASGELKMGEPPAILTAIGCENGKLTAVDVTENPNEVADEVVAVGAFKVYKPGIDRVKSEKKAKVVPPNVIVHVMVRPV